MPPAILAALLGAGVSAATAVIITQLITTAVITIGASYITKALTKKPSAGDFSSQLRARTLTARQPISPRRIIYGSSRVGGIYTFVHTTGSSNQFLNLVITLSGHEINSVEKLYFDGEEVETAFAEAFASQHYNEDDVAFSDDTYFQRNSTPYSTTAVVNQSPETDPTLWTLSSAGSSSEWQAISYSTGTKVFIWVFGAKEYYVRTAAAYPTREVTEGRPENTPSLWANVPAYTSNELFAIDGFKNFVTVEINLGTEDQAAFPGLIAAAPDKWTEEHRQLGCAGVFVQLKFDIDKFPNGIPNITFDVLGKNDIFDPRTSMTAYTANSSLCLADYLSLTTLGIGAVYSTEILDDDLIEAANICDEQVALAAGGTENRYETNGTLGTNETPFNNIQSLVGAMAGAAVTRGKEWLIRAGAYRAPEISALTEGDFVGAIDTQTLVSRVNSFNGVKGIFTAPENDWQPDDFPAVQVQAYVDEDGQEVWGEVSLPLTTSVTMAQRIARIFLELTRRQISVRVPAKMLAYQLLPFDTVPLTIDRYGWADKTFQTSATKLIIGETWNVNLNLREIDANAYAWSPADETDYPAAPRTTLPGTFDATPPGLTVTDEVAATPTGGAVTNLIATVQPAADAFVNEFEVQFKLSTDSDYTTMGRGTGLIYQSSNVVDGLIYDVRTRSISVIGVKSEWSAIRQHTVIGQTDLPPDVTGFTISIVDGAANLSWEPVGVVDLSHYRIKHSGALSGATWESSIVLVDRVGRPATSITVPALVGTYLLKAVDYGPSGDGSDGRESENPTLIVSNVEALRTFNAVEAVQEEPDFLGDKVQTVVVGTNLQLDYQDDIFLRADWFGVTDFFLGEDGLYASGTYHFENFIDLGDIFTSRVTANIAVAGDNQNADLFSRPDFFGVDDFFGVLPSQWGAELQIRTTDDTTTSPIVWTDWQTFITGDYAAEGLDFQLVLTSNEFGVTPVVSELGVVVDMPDENRAEDDLVVTVSGLTIAFAPSFRALKGLSISAQGLQTGDYYSISSKDEVGFDIAFFDSSDVAIQRTFDYVAVGYGRVS